MTAQATVHSGASLVSRPIVLKRVEWEAMTTPTGRVEPVPVKDTWHAQIVRHSRTDVTVIPMVGCPLCGHWSMLTPTPKAAREVSRMFGRQVPVAHKIDTYGKVTPDFQCMHPSCDFHRPIYLDRWQQARPLYAIAFTRGRSEELEIVYCHASTQPEARAHLGLGDFNIIAIGPAVGFYVNEKTGKLST